MSPAAEFAKLDMIRRENLLMETAMRIMEIFDDMMFTHKLNPDLVDNYGSIERLQLFTDWAREFEETYYGTTEYEDDYLELSDHYAQRKLKELFGEGVM